MQKMSLAAARVNAGKTQRELSKEIGVCRNIVLDWEKGRRYPTMEELEKYCGACNCTVNDVNCKVLVIQNA